MISRKGWFIASDENAKWCYIFGENMVKKHIDNIT